MKPAERKKIVRRLMKAPVTGVSFKGNSISMRFDGERIWFRIVRNRARRHVGEWHRKKPLIYVDEEFGGRDADAVALHEAIEKFVAKQYGLDTDTEAHRIAECHERKWLLGKGGNWRSHQLKVYYAWEKRGMT
jgi:hypothetical protein